MQPDYWMRIDLGTIFKELGPLRSLRSISRYRLRRGVEGSSRDFVERSQIVARRYVSTLPQDMSGSRFT